MYWITRGILVLTLAYASTSFALPTAGCLEYEHCSTGYFCEVAVRLCRKCVQCEDLGRLRPAVDTDCVKSITQCGGCLEGLAMNLARTRCGSASEEGQSPEPWWWWAVVAGALLLTLLGGGATLLVLRNFETYKILACTTTQSPIPSASSAGVEASAPEAPPPPYNDVIPLPAHHCEATQSPMPPESRPGVEASTPEVPPPLYNDVIPRPAHHYEEAFPYIKPIGVGAGAGGSVGAGGARRDPAERQSAQVFNNPAYVRIAQPPSNDVPNSPGSLPTIQEVSTDSTDQSHSTRMPVWEEHAIPNMPIAGRTARPVEACQWSNENNNDSDASPDGSTGDCAGGGGGGTAFIINVIRNVNTVAQRNHLNT